MREVERFTRLRLPWTLFDVPLSSMRNLAISPRASTLGVVYVLPRFFLFSVRCCFRLKIKKHEGERCLTLSNPRALSLRLTGEYCSRNCQRLGMPNRAGDCLYPFRRRTNGMCGGDPREEIDWRRENECRDWERGMGID